MTNTSLTRYFEGLSRGDLLQIVQAFGRNDHLPTREMVAGLVELARAYRLSVDDFRSRFQAMDDRHLLDGVREG